MDEEALQSLLSLASQPAQAQALQYFERLKATENGWELCAEALLSGQYQRDDQVRYFCYQVIEHFIRTRYASGSNVACHPVVKSFLISTVQQQVSMPSPDKSFIKNKIAQLWSLVFVVDYPQQVWPEFFADLLAMLPLGEVAVDMYLRILRAIDTEVVDREVAHTDFEQVRNTKIKDSMRETCVTQLVESWYQIITGYEVANPSLVCTCLTVVGLYVAWIDILLVANDNFVGILLRFMKILVLRESACDCINEIICKGMSPVAKMKLIESFTAVLQSAGVMYPTEDEEGDFVAKLSKLVNSIGVSLIAAWGKLAKGEEAAAQALAAVQAKLPLLQRFLGDDDDDVSAAVAPFASDYIGLLKQLSPISSLQKESVQALIFILLKKMRYADDYDFEAEGEEEAMFQDYRKHLKILFNSLASLDGQLILQTVHSVLTAALRSWQHLDFAEVEVAITLFYMLGEVLPAWSSSNLDLILNLTPKVAGVSPKGGSSRNGTCVTAVNGSGVPPDAGILQDMMKMLLASNVSRYSHPAVVLQFFETAVRYEKFFLAQPRYIGDMLAAFLDDRGLRNESARVRSRVSYLFTRFTKAVRAHLTLYTEDVLQRLEELLVLNVPSCSGAPAAAAAGGDFLPQRPPQWLTNEEQMFLYEVASSLIVTGDFPSNRKSLLMGNLLAPVVQKFQETFARLCSETDEQRQLALAEALNSIMSVTSRASKGFSMQQTMKVCACVDVFTTTLKVYVSALDSPCQRALLQQGVRQYFHRMIVCLEEDVLPFVPATVQQLLKSPPSARELHDFLPLMNQLVTKFKKTLEPFARDAFSPLVATIFHVLASPLDERDTVGLSDKHLLRRSYFQFLSSIVSNDLADVIRNQGVQGLREILMTVIQGAVESGDPQSQKTCFAILRQLIKLWGGKDGMLGFDEFTLESVVPACFMTPLKDTFDWSDGQTVLVLTEIANCLKAAQEKLDASLTQYLLSDYFPRMSVPSPAAEGICSSLQGDPKKFRSYLKAFYDNARSVS